MANKGTHMGALVVFVLAPFGYIVLLLLGPFLVGPWILIAAVVLGAIVVWTARHHVRRRGRQPHVDVRLGWRNHPRRVETSLSKEVAFTFLLGTFVALILALGVILQSRYATVGGDAVVSGLGAALVNVAIFIGLGILAEADPRYALGVPFLVEATDTTDDK